MEISRKKGNLKKSKTKVREKRKEMSENQIECEQCINNEKSL